MAAKPGCDILPFMEQPMFVMKPSPWVLLALAAVILVLAGAALGAHAEMQHVAFCVGAGAAFAVVAMVLRRRAQRGPNSN